MKFRELKLTCGFQHMNYYTDQALLLSAYKNGQDIVIGWNGPTICIGYEIFWIDRLQGMLFEN